MQCCRQLPTAWTRSGTVCTIRTLCVLPHVKKLDDALGAFLVRVVCECGARREIKPEALVVLSHTRQLRMCTADCSAT
jgi:hypothetical protein